jgi:hypothetical protein
MWLILAVLLSAAIPRNIALAAFGDDQEKPKPEFTRTGRGITARLIPHAKSSSVSIHFQAAGGNLVKVEGMDFSEAKHPSVDNKDFKSELFVVEIDGVVPGGEAKISVISDFFTGSTAFWIYNQNLKAPWMNANALNISHPDQVQELLIAVKDGGPFDSDGVADGRITLIGGPRDSFWGYAMGTLFIRFFGIFLVLGILMIGMILSGKVFQHIDNKSLETQNSRRPKSIVAQEDFEPPEIETQISPELAAVVSLALLMHLSALNYQESDYFFTPDASSWLRQGREQIMNARSVTLNRGNRLQNQ